MEKVDAKMKLITKLWRKLFKKSGNPLKAVYLKVYVMVADRNIDKRIHVVFPIQVFRNKNKQKQKNTKKKNKQTNKNKKQKQKQNTKTKKLN